MNLISGSVEPGKLGFVTRQACPLCRSVTLETLCELPFDSPPMVRFLSDYYRIDPRLLEAAAYRLQECRRCHLIFQGNIGDAALMAALYGSWITTFDDPEIELPAYRRAISEYPLGAEVGELRAAASLLCRDVTAMRTLDYGMGWALWARIAVRMGAASFGSDIAAKCIDHARRHGIACLTEDEVAQGGFDFINTEQVFEHLPDPAGTLALLSGALAPGGILKISVPSGEAAPAIAEQLRTGNWDGSYGMIIPVHPLEHINSFRHRTMACAAELCGLEVVRPRLRDAYAFTGTAMRTMVARPRSAARELVRPFYRYHNKANIYAWLRKPT